MARPTVKPTADRVPLSRDRVLRAAIDLADEHGIGALTMRRLASALGVEAMTLYYHVGKKDDLLNGIVDVVTGEIELPGAGADWRAGLRRTALSAYATYLRHRWAASLSLAASDVGPARMRYMDEILGTLRGAGFSAEQTDLAYHALESHIMGFSLWEVGLNIPEGEDFEAMARGFLDQLPTDQFPHLAEHIHQHLQPRAPGDEGTFAFGVDVILDGLERLRGTRSSR